MPGPSSETLSSTVPLRGLDASTRIAECSGAYVLALAFLLVRPQGLFGEKIIERV